MSETITEMVLPGTYIEVRAEGLIGVGGISTGNLGVAGTANRGPVNEVRVLGSFSEALETFGSYDAWPSAPADRPNALSLVRLLELAFQGGASTVYAVRISSTEDMESRSIEVQTSASNRIFDLTATSPGTWANDITARVEGAAGEPSTLTLELGTVKEQFSGNDAGELHDAVNEGSRLVTASGLADADRGRRPAQLADGPDGGPDGSNVSATELADGLAVLADQNVNLVVAANFAATAGAATVLGHLEQTENDARERIAVMGASSDDAATVIADDVSAASSPRLVLVAPGVQATDAPTGRIVDLPAPYAAALVAGRLSTLAPHVSATNKTVAAAGLTTEYSRAQQKRLLQNQVLVLHRHLGIRILKGITTDVGAFRQISVRRIVDFAKAGVRIGANPYIGKLNNGRVRAALKATLDGFLSGMVLDEQLTGYELDVTATRRQEIEGTAVVTMTLQPTFSIDFIKVIMNLQ